MIAILPLIALAAGLASFVWSVSDPPRAGHLDAYAASRIHSTCHWQSQCIIRMRELFEGDWDTFYEFGPGVSQAEVDRILSPAKVQVVDDRRLLVLTRDNRIVASEHEKTGAVTPLDGEVEFGDERHRDANVVQLGRDTRLQVTPFPTEDPPGQRGTFFVLSPLN